MARSEGAIRLEIAKLKKMIALLRLGGASTKKEVDNYGLQIKALEAELAKAAKK